MCDHRQLGAAHQGDVQDTDSTSTAFLVLNRWHGSLNYQELTNLPRRGAALHESRHEANSALPLSKIQDMVVEYN